MTGFVGRQHEFHDHQYVEDWSARFVPTSDRNKLFDTIIDRLSELSLANFHVVELGIGPAYLADRLLQRNRNVTYEGVDFSVPMLDIARQRLSSHGKRVQLTHADLLSYDWTSKLQQPVGAFVSTWALHDLGGQQQTLKVYRDCRNALSNGGVLIDGDFVKPEGTDFEFEPGRFSVSRHLELFSEAGFHNPRLLIFLEKETKNPTPAQNYACMEGLVV